MALYTANLDSTVETFKSFLKDKLKQVSQAPKIALIAGVDDKSADINPIVKILEELNIQYSFRTFQNGEEAISYIEELNEDKSIHAILVNKESFGEERQDIVNKIAPLKDVGLDSEFNKSVFFSNFVSTSPKMWAIRVILETNGYATFTPYSCAVLGIHPECFEIMHYLNKKGATSMLARPYTRELQKLIQLADIVIINDVSMVSSNCFKEDAFIINACGPENEFNIAPTSGGTYVNYENFYKVYCLAVAWMTLVSYLTITREEIENDD
jgi:5,10-methylene-tetrahydrofolate dehydrogenase/methenyl tetrahydrofolate cyclohydrolase